MDESEQVGRILDGEGGYTVYGRLMPAADSIAQGALPLGLAIPSFYVIVGWQAASAIFHLSRVIHFWNVSDSDVVDSA